MIAPTQHQVLLHTLTDDLDFFLGEAGERERDEVGIVPTKVMKEYWNFVLLSGLKVASCMCSPSVISVDVIMITDLVHHLAIDQFEWMFADGALSRQKEVFLVVICHYHALIVEEICDAPLFQISEFVQHPVHTIFASVYLYFKIIKIN